MVAVAAGTVFYSLVLAVGRDPLPALTPPQQPRLQPPAAPQHLAPVPETTAPSKFTDDGRPAAAHITVPVRLTLASGQLLPPDAGIATFDAETAADFRWYAIPAIADDATEVTVPTACTQGQTLTITFAADRSQARHGYLSRRDVICDAHAVDQHPVVELSARTTPVSFVLPVDGERAGPLRLGRVDDPQWVAMGHDRIGLTITRGSPLSLQLGDGEYELTDPLSGQYVQRFVVPTTSRVTIDANLTRARAGHR